MTDLRDAARSLRATPLVTAVAVVSLALGIGANAAMFAIVDALLLRPLPVAHARRLAALMDGDRPHGWPNPVWEAVRARDTLFDGAFAFGMPRFDLAPRGVSDPANGLLVSGRMFEVLGVRAALGRTLQPSDDRRDIGSAAAVAVISHDFWQRRFGGANDVVGRTITLDRTPVTIVGVTPRGFFGPHVGRSFDVAVPLAAEALVRGRAHRLDSRSDWYLQIIVRLRQGQTAERATAALRTIQPRIADEARPTNWRPEAAAAFLRDPLVLRPAAAGTSSLRQRYSRSLFALVGVVGLTLLVACGNIANLLLARATARRHELGVRTALGASPARLARLLLVESLLLAASGAALGVLVALWLSRVVVTQLSSAAAGVSLAVGPDWRLFSFLAAVAAATALLFGAGPAVRGARVPPLEAMADRAQGRASGSRGGIAGALVVAQVALSLVLLAGAGLFVRTFATLADRDLGFERDRALVVGVDAQRTGLDSAALLSLYEQVRDAALAVPGVSHAALSVMTPVSGDTRNWGIELPGRAPFPERERYVMMNLVSPGWFATMGTPLVAGRDFDTRDRAGSPRAMIVNRAFVAKYLAGESPVGRTILEERRPTADPRPMEIVGVVGDAVYESAREAPPPTMYWPLLQMRRPQSGVTLTVRASATSPASLAHSVGAAVLAVHPDLALSFRPFQGIVDASLAQERLVATLSGYFGALALLLAALGLYGVTAYTVSRRRFELGIRMALGATPGGVLRLVLARVALLVGGGLAAGAAVVWWASPLVASLLYAVGPHDLFTLGAAFAVLAAVGLVAGWLPALRAARTDPARVLREA